MVRQSKSKLALGSEVGGPLAGHESEAVWSVWRELGADHG